MSRAGSVAYVLEIVNRPAPSRLVWRYIRTVVADAFDCMLHVFRLEPHGLAVAYGKFEGANIGGVQARIVNFAENSTLQRVPDV